MTQLNFYEIKSEKSQEYIDGLRKTCLACIDHPDIQFFLWFDREGSLKQVQFLFNENLIEWYEGKKDLKVNETNRKFKIVTSKRGIQKGVRTLHPSQDEEIIKQGMRILNISKLPPTFDDIVRNNLLPAQTSS